MCALITYSGFLKCSEVRIFFTYTILYWKYQLFLCRICWFLTFKMNSKSTDQHNYQNLICKLGNWGYLQCGSHYSRHSGEGDEFCEKQNNSKLLFQRSWFCWSACLSEDEWYKPLMNKDRLHCIGLCVLMDPLQLGEFKCSIPKLKSFSWDQPAQMCVFHTL